MHELTAKNYFIGYFTSFTFNQGSKKSLSTLHLAGLLLSPTHANYIKKKHSFLTFQQIISKNSRLKFFARARKLEWISGLTLF